MSPSSLWSVWGCIYSHGVSDSLCQQIIWLSNYFIHNPQVCHSCTAEEGDLPGISVHLFYVCNILPQRCVPWKGNVKSTTKSSLSLPCLPFRIWMAIHSVFRVKNNRHILDVAKQNLNTATTYQKLPKRQLYFFISVIIQVKETYSPISYCIFKYAWSD